MSRRGNILRWDQILYPCNLGIKLYHNYSESLIDELINSINLVYDSFFYDIVLYEQCEINLTNLMNVGRNEILDTNEHSIQTIMVYPTQYFYNSLTDGKESFNSLQIKLGITDLPLYSSTYENLIFLYGEAHLNEKCAIVSSYNLGDFESTHNKEHHSVEERIIKESIHEIGHLILGDLHCLNSICVMNYSNNLQKVDKKSASLCIVCEEKLEVIREHHNF